MRKINEAVGLHLRVWVAAFAASAAIWGVGLFQSRNLDFSIAEAVAEEREMSQPEILLLRKSYYLSSENSSEADSFYKNMKSVSDRDEPLAVGYRGMSALLLAAHSYNPVSKLSYFREGRDLLEQAIKKDPANVELRFLRYGVQDNAPFFLSYRDELDADRELLLEAIRFNASHQESATDRSQDPSAQASSSAAGKLLDADLLSRIAKYLMEHAKLSADDKKACQRFAR